MSQPVIDIPEVPGLIIERLRGAGHRAYAVGGCVRDSLIGKAPHDWDVCTSAGPGETEALFPDMEIIETGIKHGTVTVLAGREACEVTTFRVDGEYTDNRHPDSVRFVADVREDLARRDFTVNAMAYAPGEGLIDPFGGREDLAGGVIRCVGDPDLRFNEDGLRILRALRFASTYGFTIEPGTAESVHRNRALLGNIARERVREELVRLLLGAGALPVMQEFSDVVTEIVPELAPCVGFDQNSRWHIYDVYEHTLRAAASYTGDDPVVKLALLLHDIGKPRSYSCDERGGHFYGHAGVSRDIADDIMRGLRFDTRTRHAVTELVLYHDTPIEPTGASVRRWLNRLDTEQFRRLLEVRRGDVSAQAPFCIDERLRECDELESLMEQVLAEERCFRQRDLAVNGRDLIDLGMSPGRELGAVLHALLDLVVSGELPNTREALLDRAAEMIKQEK